jgi:hypothetical protein
MEQSHARHGSQKLLVLLCYSCCCSLMAKTLHARNTLPHTLQDVISYANVTLIAGSGSCGTAGWHSASSAGSIASYVLSVRAFSCNEAFPLSSYKHKTSRSSDRLKLGLFLPAVAVGLQLSAAAADVAGCLKGCCSSSVVKDKVV